MFKSIVVWLTKMVAAFIGSYWFGATTGAGIKAIAENEDSKPWNIAVTLIGMYLVTYSIIFKTILPAIDELADYLIPDKEEPEVLEETETE